MYHAATGSYRVYNQSSVSTRKVVGLNNLGEITFIWGAGDDKKVNHSLRWYDPKYPTLVRFTTYTVLLDPNHADYPLLKQPDP